MFPDIATVEIATVVLAGTMALLLAWTWFAHHLSSALVWWAAAYALGAAGTLMVFQDRASTLPYGVVLDDLLHISSAFALWFGFRAFNRRRVVLMPLFVVCLLYVGFVEVVVATAGYSRRAFIDAALLIVIGLCVLSISEVLGGRRGGKSWRMLASAIVIGHCFALGVRILADIEGPVHDIATTEYFIHTALIIEPAVLPVLLGYTLLALAFERRNADTQSIAERDALTGVLNRRGLNTWIATGRHPLPLSVIVFDLDHFKSINDTHGHAVGDSVLQEVAERVTGEIRGSDAFARIGGEEFVVFVPGTGADGAMLLAERMRSALETEPLVIGETALTVTGSFGVHVTESIAGAAADDAIAVADDALYDAKRSGRNRVVMAAAA